MTFSVPITSLSFSEKIAQFFSFEIPTNILDTVNKNIPGKMSASEVQYILPNKIKFKNLEVSEKNGARVLFGESVELSVSLLSLLTKNIIIKEALVEGLFFNYTIKKSQHNVIDVFSDAKESSSASNESIKVTIENAAVHNGVFEMEHDSGVKIVAHGIEAKGKFWVKNGPFAADIQEAKIPYGTIYAAGLDLPISDLKANKLFISDEKVFVENLFAYYETSPLSGSGTVFIAQERYDIKAHLERKTQEWPTGLQKLFFNPPKFNADIKLTGKLTSPIIHASLKTENTAIKGIEIKNAQIDGVISEHSIDISSSKINLGQNAVANIKGKVDFASNTYTFKTDSKNIFVQELFDFFALKKSAKGLLSGNIDVKGNYGTKEALSLSGFGEIKNALFEDYALDGVSTYDLNVFYDFKDSLKVSNFILKDKKGLHLAASGQGNLSKKIFDFSFKAFCFDIKKYWKKSLDDFEAKNINLHGRFLFENDESFITSKVFAGNIKYKNDELSNVKTNFRLEKNDFYLENIQGIFYQGFFEGQFFVFDAFKKGELKGEFLVKELDLSALSKNHTKKNILGKVNGELALRGTIEHPAVEIKIDTQKFQVESFLFGETKLQANCSTKLCTVKNLYGYGFGGLIESSYLDVEFNTGKIDGTILLNNLQLNKVFTDLELSKDIFGSVSGKVILSGVMEDIRANSNLAIDKLEMYGVKAGSGPVVLNLSKGNKFGDKNKNNFIFSLSASLRDKNSTSTILAAYDIDKKNINLKVDFEELDISMINFNESLPFFNGNLSGRIVAKGNIENPSIDIDAYVPKFWLSDSLERLTIEKNETKKNYLGPFIFSSSLKNGQANFKSCASLSALTDTKICEEKMDLNLQASGPFNKDSFSLDFQGSLHAQKFEEILLSLKKELISLSLSSDFSGKISKKNNQPLIYEGNAKINSITASMPNFPSINLKKPAEISFNNKGISLDSLAQFDFSPGELNIVGGYQNESINISLSGEIPLSLAKFFAPIVQRAEGLAIGNLSLTGKITQPVLDGKIEFSNKSKLIFKSFFEPIEINNGFILFSKKSETSFITSVKKLDLNIGDGKLNFKGDFLQEYEKTTISNKSDIFNFVIKGKNVVFRNKRDFIESDFNIETTKDSDGKTTTHGTIQISDGYAHRKFDLRNFIADVKEDNTSTFGLFSDINNSLDIRISVSQFYASAQMLNLDINSTITGQLNLKGSFATPKFFGSLALREGQVHFPSASFDLVETQIELDENSKRAFDPKINISAIREFTKEQFPILNQNTMVELSLVGDLDRLNLSLKPISGDIKLSQFKIFLLLLSPRSGQSSNFENQTQSLVEGAKAAALTFSGEVFLRPLTNELQELLEGRTDTKIQFGSALDPKGVTLSLSWKIGQRIDVFGNYLLSSKKNNVYDKKNEEFLLGENDSLGDLQVSILLLDHKPFGPLYLQTNFGSFRDKDYQVGLRGSAKVIYRVLNK